MKYIFIFTILFYAFIFFVDLFRPKSEEKRYLWYMKYPETRTYTLFDLIKDIPYIKKNFGKITLILWIIKLFLLLIWPFIRLVQVFVMLNSFIFFSLSLIFCYILGLELVVPLYFSKRTIVETIPSFILFFLIKNPVCLGYKILYLCLKRIYEKSSVKPNWLMIIHNFILSRFIGISIKTHHNIDIIAIAIYDSFKHPEICKGLHIIPQIMSHNFFIAHEFFIDKTQTQVRSFKIITRPYIILNPLIFISKRFMLNQMIKIRGEEVKGVGAVIQASNNTIHSSAIVVINTNRIRGVLNTHKPLKNQIFLRRGPFPNSKDNRDQYTTLNNIFDANMIIKDKTNLLHRTHVDKEGEEMINFNDTYSVLNPDAQWSIHTNEGHKIVDPHSETMLGIAGILEETSIWKNIRTDKYNLMSKSEQKWHRQRFAAYMNTKQKHFFFKEEKFSNPKYFEDELRTGWRNETHAPFRNISDI